MISNDIKTRIVLAISGNRQNYATDAKHAVALGISTSVYSEIKKGNTEQKLSDAKWMSIARRLGVSLDDGAEWKIVKTPTFEYLTSQLELCRAKSLSGMFCEFRTSARRSPHNTTPKRTRTSSTWTARR